MTDAEQVIVDSLRERLANALIDAERSHDTAMNSYGAGYDRGVVDTLKAILTDITSVDH